MTNYEALEKRYIKEINDAEASQVRLYKELLEAPTVDEADKLLYMIQSFGVVSKHNREKLNLLRYLHREHVILPNRKRPRRRTSKAG